MADDAAKLTTKESDLEEQKEQYTESLKELKQKAIAAAEKEDELNVRESGLNARDSVLDTRQAGLDTKQAGLESREEDSYRKGPTRSN